jgi:hypothetical protein
LANKFSQNVLSPSLNGDHSCRDRSSGCLPLFPSNSLTLRQTGREGTPTIRRSPNTCNFQANAQATMDVRYQTRMNREALKRERPYDWDIIRDEARSKTRDLWTPTASGAATP